MAATSPSLRLISRLTLVAAVAAIACARGRGDAGTSPEPPSDAPTTLEVQNLGFADVTIYAITATGSRIRLGIVNGNSVQQLTLPSHLVRRGGTLRFLADPIGGRRAHVTEEIFVSPGETVTLTIPLQ